MRWKLLVGVLLTASIFLTIIASATPIGKIDVKVSTPQGLQGAKVYYDIWTFTKNGSIVVIKRGTLGGHLFFKNSIYLSKGELQKIKNSAETIGSKTSFIGVDLWIEKDGKVYSLIDGVDKPLSALSGWGFEKSIELTLNLKDASAVPIPHARIKTLSKGITPESPTKHWYEWRTIREQRFQNVKIPILIIHNNVWSDIFGTADIGITALKYWGPDVTVAFGDMISEKVKFDPSSIKVKVLERSITDYYAGGDDITVPKEYRWGYVWIKGTVHYIYQKEYFCYKSAYHPQPTCLFTGNERYFAKIDSFTIDRVSGNVKHITSGSTLGKPPYNFPSSWMERSSGINGTLNRPIYVADFYGEIYTGSNGCSFCVGVPVGAILDALADGSLPPWFATVTVGFSVSDYSSYVMLGHVKNKGPSSTVTFHAMESKYKVEIPVKHWFWTSHEDVNVPIGLYVEADYS
ncbi:hypothetical protein [Thermococcus sp.]|uniref:hypothetical protein n=2 Tax=Thermococcus sp. TaxID=35749 RepID=UPI00260BF957|nr:hypothetical protein [Thermococcus sp.]